MGKTITPNVHLPERTLIKQPASQDLRIEQGVCQLTERWKGLYTHCSHVAAALYSVDQVQYWQFTTAAGQLCAEYTTPSAPFGMAWVLGQATVDECDAGENGILQIVWNGVSADVSADTSVKSWSLQWQPENYDPYAYCKNPAQHQSEAANGSQRVAVEQCLHPPIGQNVMTQNKLFQDNSGIVLKLNDNEQKILEWKLQGKHVIKHHPQVTLTQSWSNIPYKKISELPEDAAKAVEPDVIDEPEETFGLDNYTWVCQGSNIQQTQPDVSKDLWTVTKTTSWTGALSVVPEFYGSNAWTFGEM